MYRPRANTIIDSVSSRNDAIPVVFIDREWSLLMSQNLSLWIRNPLKAVLVRGLKQEHYRGD
jgi:hypothetical protein